MAYRSRPTSPPITHDDAIEIHKRRAMGEAIHTIAASFRVNPGRISEVLSAQRALLFYALKRLGLDVARDSRPPHVHHIVLINRAEIDAVTAAAAHP